MQLKIEHRESRDRVDIDSLKRREKKREDKTIGNKTRGRLNFNPQTRVYTCMYMFVYVHARVCAPVCFIARPPPRPPALTPLKNKQESDKAQIYATQMQNKFTPEEETQFANVLNRYPEQQKPFVDAFSKMNVKMEKLLKQLKPPSD